MPSSPCEVVPHPAGSGYLLLAAEVDRRPFFFPSSRSKRRLIGRCRRLRDELVQELAVRRATVFRAVLLPPSGARAVLGAGGPRRARYDVVLFVETEDREAAAAVRAGAAWRELERHVGRVARRRGVVLATDVKRIARVDHSRDGVFLFNYFVAEDTTRTVAVWEETSRWFRRETGLDNSELMRPVNASETPYTVINHCRWDRMRYILPPLLLKRSVRTEVLTPFRENGITPMPVLYRLA